MQNDVEYNIQCNEYIIIDDIRYMVYVEVCVCVCVFASFARARRRAKKL